MSTTGCSTVTCVAPASSSWVDAGPTPAATRRLYVTHEPTKSGVSGGGGPSSLPAGTRRGGPAGGGGGGGGGGAGGSRGGRPAGRAGGGAERGRERGCAALALGGAGRPLQRIGRLSQVLAVTHQLESAQSRRARRGRAAMDDVRARVGIIE